MEIGLSLTSGKNVSCCFPAFLYERNFYMHICEDINTIVLDIPNTFCSLIYRVHTLFSMLICILLGISGLTDVDEVARDSPLLM